jgi:hypothetical protein
MTLEDFYIIAAPINDKYIESNRFTVKTLILHEKMQGMILYSEVAESTSGLE